MLAERVESLATLGCTSSTDDSKIIDIFGTNPNIKLSHASLTAPGSTFNFWSSGQKNITLENNSNLSLSSLTTEGTLELRNSSATLSNKLDLTGALTLSENSSLSVTSGNIGKVSSATIDNSKVTLDGNRTFTFGSLTLSNASTLSFSNEISVTGDSSVTGKSSVSQKAKATVQNLTLNDSTWDNSSDNVSSNQTLKFTHVNLDNGATLTNTAASLQMTGNMADDASKDADPSEMTGAVVVKNSSIKLDAQSSLQALVLDAGSNFTVGNSLPDKSIKIGSLNTDSNSITIDGKRFEVQRSARIKNTTFTIVDSRNSKWGTKSPSDLVTFIPAGVNFTYDRYQYEGSTFNISGFDKSRLNGTFSDTNINVTDANLDMVYTKTYGGTLNVKQNHMYVSEDDQIYSGASANLSLYSSYFENATVNVDHNRIDLYDMLKYGKKNYLPFTPTTFKNSTINIDKSSDNPDNSSGAAFRPQYGAGLVLDDSTLNYTNPIKNEWLGMYTPVIFNGQGLDGSTDEYVELSGNSVINTPIDDPVIRDSMLVGSYVNRENDKLVVTGGSYQFYYNAKAPQFDFIVKATNGDANGNGELKLFTLSDELKSQNELTFNKNGQDGTYTYSVANASQDGEKHVFAPYYTIRYNLNQKGMWDDGSYDNKSLLSMTGYALKDTKDVDSKTQPSVSVAQAPGYTFIGWKKDGDDKVYTTDETLAYKNNSDITWNAQYKSDASFGVRYVNPINNSYVTLSTDNDGKDPSGHINTYRKVSEYSSTFALDTKHFLKWNTKADGTGEDYAPGQTVTVEANNDEKNGGLLTLYAIFEPSTPRIVFSANGGTFSDASVFKQNRDIFDIQEDEFGGEIAVLKGDFKDSEKKTLDAVLKSLKPNASTSSLGLTKGWAVGTIYTSLPGWETGNDNKPAVTREPNYLEGDQIPDAPFRSIKNSYVTGTFGTDILSWYSDNQGNNPVDITGSMVLDHDMTFYVGYQYNNGYDGKPIAVYNAYNQPIQADAFINDSANTKRIVDVIPEEKYSVTAVIDMSEVKKQLTGIDKNADLRRWAEKPYATAYPDARSTFTTEIYIPQGVNADAATVSVAGYGELFYVSNINKVDLDGDGKTDKFEVQWKLKQSTEDANVGTENGTEPTGTGAHNLKPEDPSQAPQWANIDDPNYNYQAIDNTYFNSDDYKKRQINTYGALRDAIWSVGITDTDHYSYIDNTKSSTDADTSARTRTTRSADTEASSTGDSYGYQEGRINIAKNAISITLNGLYVENSDDLENGQTFTLHGKLNGNFSSLAVNTVGVTKAFDFNWVADQIDGFKDPLTLPNDNLGTYATVRVVKQTEVSSQADLEVIGGKADGSGTEWNSEEKERYYVDRDTNFALRSSMSPDDLISKLNDMVANMTKQIVDANSISEADAKELAQSTPLSSFSGSLTGTITLADQIDAVEGSNPVFDVTSDFFNQKVEVTGKTAKVTISAKEGAKPTLAQLIEFFEQFKDKGIVWSDLKLNDTAIDKKNISSVSSWDGTLKTSLIIPSTELNGDLTVSNDWKYVAPQTDEGRDAIITANTSATEDDKKRVQLTIYTDSKPDDSLQEISSQADMQVINGQKDGSGTDWSSEHDERYFVDRNTPFGLKSIMYTSELIAKLDASVENMAKQIEVAEGVDHAQALGKAQTTALRELSGEIEGTMTLNDLINTDASDDPILDLDADFVKKEITRADKTITVKLSFGPKADGTLPSSEEIRDYLVKLGSTGIEWHGLTLDEHTQDLVNVTSTSTWSGTFKSTLVVESQDGDLTVINNWTYSAPQADDGRDAIIGADATDQEKQQVQLTIYTNSEPAPEDKDDKKHEKPTKAVLPRTSDVSWPILPAGIAGAFATLLGLARKRKHDQD